MKKLNNKTKILIFLILIIIISGLAVALTKGYNFELKYEETKKIELYLGKEFEITDIKSITDETIKDQSVLIQKVEVYKDSVNIIAKEITEEQKESLINKVNEKYGTELSKDDITIETVPHITARDILKPYIVPFAMATVGISIYFAIRYYKLGMMKTILKSFGLVMLWQIVLFSVIAITRIPIGRLTIPMVIIVYILSLAYITTNFEKQLLTKNKEDNK